jgi:hypothetical protein
MKGVITIFSMPQELEDLALTLEKLKRNSAFIDKSVNYKVEVTMCLSDTLTDWNNTQLPKEYIKDRTSELCQKYLDWCEYSLQFDNEEVLGCVSQRRWSLKNNPDADFFIWLDCDLLFKDTTLYYITSAYQMVKESGLDMFVVTPQFLKQWDNTWDVVANKKYWNHPLNYHLEADTYDEVLPQLEEVNVSEINTFKFAGGWFTLISRELLEKVGVPESFGHYGLEDTFIMFCSLMMKQKGEAVSQFVIENIIANEIHKNRTNQTIKNYISSIDKKQEFKKVAEENFEKELNNFNNK